MKSWFDAQVDYQLNWLKDARKNAHMVYAPCNDKMIIGDSYGLVSIPQDWALFRDKPLVDMRVRTVEIDTGKWFISGECPLTVTGCTELNTDGEPLQILADSDGRKVYIAEKVWKKLKPFFDTGTPLTITDSGSNSCVRFACIDEVFAVLMPVRK